MAVHRGWPQSSPSTFILRLSSVPTHSPQPFLSLLTPFYRGGDGGPERGSGTGQTTILGFVFSESGIESRSEEVLSWSHIRNPRETGEILRQNPGDHWIRGPALPSQYFQFCPKNRAAGCLFPHTLSYLQHDISRLSLFKCIHRPDWVMWKVKCVGKLLEKSHIPFIWA